MQLQRSGEMQRKQHEKHVTSLEPVHHQTPFRIPHPKSIKNPGFNNIGRSKSKKTKRTPILQMPTNARLQALVIWNVIENEEINVSENNINHDENVFLGAIKKKQLPRKANNSKK